MPRKFWSSCLRIWCESELLLIKILWWTMYRKGNWERRHWMIRKMMSSVPQKVGSWMTMTKMMTSRWMMISMLGQSDNVVIPTQRTRWYHHAFVLLFFPLLYSCFRAFSKVKNRVLVCCKTFKHFILGDSASASTVIFELYQAMQALSLRNWLLNLRALDIH